MALGNAAMNSRIIMPFYGRGESRPMMSTDIALVWNNALLRADIGIARGDIATDAGLQTAVIISLLSDREAAPGDVLPDDGGPRG